jgi:hypothetical protein
MRFIQARFLAVFLAAAMLVSCGSNSNSTAEDFMSLLVAGKHLQAQEMLSRDMRSMATMLGGVSNDSLNPYYQFGRFKSFKLSEIEKTNNAVRYKVVATTNDGRTFHDFLDMVHEDGKWKVARF